MSKLYLPHINDADWINKESDILIQKCENIEPLMYTVYHSFSFIDGTGYVEKVLEEIELVLQSNKGNCYINDPDEFIRRWQINKYLGHNLSQLSGGWKKYLSLALFTNLKSEGKIYFDAFRQLSDRLIDSFLKSVIDTKISAAFLFEYDVSLFPAGCPKNDVFLRNLEADLTFANLTDQKNDLSVKETNYYAGN